MKTKQGRIGAAGLEGMAIEHRASSSVHGTSTPNVWCTPTQNISWGGEGHIRRHGCQGAAAAAAPQPKYIMRWWRLYYCETLRPRRIAPPPKIYHEVMKVVVRLGGHDGAVAAAAHTWPEGGGFVSNLRRMAIIYYNLRRMTTSHQTSSKHPCVLSWAIGWEANSWQQHMSDELMGGQGAAACRCAGGLPEYFLKVEWLSSYCPSQATSIPPPPLLFQVGCCYFPNLSWKVYPLNNWFISPI